MKYIKLKNYRCYEDVQLKLKDISILVGKNNAGKSTIIEALRIVSNATQKCKKVVYVNAPSELELNKNVKGFYIDASKLKIDLRTIIYYYRDVIANILVEFKNGSKIEVFLSKEYIFAVIRDKSGDYSESRNSETSLNISNVAILPQIGLIKESEKMLSQQTVVSDKETYLSSRHFRNEIYLFKDEYFDEFKKLSESTWSNLQIDYPEYNLGDNLISLYVADNRFTCELGQMGSGLQMWLQIMWFLARSKNSDTIILDEPDVYMHPDLQVKVFRIIKNKFPQLIIATHSVEIINEADVSELAYINKESKIIKYSTDLIGAQSIVDQIGGSLNLALVKLGAAKKCIFVEGDDIKILDSIYKNIYVESIRSILDYPIIKIGGFSNFNIAKNISDFLNTHANSSIKCYCILDRDYYKNEIFEELYASAEKSNLDLHIWKRKEIENYLLDPKILFKAINILELEYDEFLKFYEKLLDVEKDEVEANLASKSQEYNKKENIKTHLLDIKKEVQKKWTSIENKVELVSGKIFLSKIISAVKLEYGKSLTKYKILKVINKENINEEIKSIINKLMDIS